MQYLYNQGDEYHFMDTENFEQIFLTTEQLGENKNFLIDNAEVEMLFFESQAIDITMPMFVNLRCNYGGSLG